MSWYDDAVSTIRTATKDMPFDTPLDKRVKAVDAAYPFGAREHFPYKMWLKARYEHLKHFGYQKRGDKQILMPLFSPLEREKQKYQRARN